MRHKYPELIVNKEDSILIALKKMDQCKRKLLIVLNKDKFVSVISIGDIQRAIIKGIDLNRPIIKILRSTVTYASTNDDFKQVKEIMKTCRTEVMPIVSPEGRLVDVIFWEDLFKEDRLKRKNLKLDLPVIIMAGGEGTRLKPLTNILPKPLIPIGDKTIIEQIMDKFCDIGCNKFFLSVNYKAEMIKYYFSTLGNTNYNISYLREESPLGTAGSLYLLKGIINSTFFVSNCDILIDQDISDILEYHKTNKNEITLVAALKNYSIPYGIMETSRKGLLQSLTEKPELTFKINTGLYILEPYLIDEIPEKEVFHITSLITKLKSQKRRVGVFPVSEKSWKDIGDMNQYLPFLK